MAEPTEIQLLAEAVLALARAVRDAPPPVINVTIPEGAPPMVTFEIPPFPELPSPSVTVNVPEAAEQAAPSVNVTVPEASVEVHVPPAVRSWRIERGRDGRPARLIAED